MEKILRISEVVSHSIKEASNWYSSYDGFEVVTDKQRILLLISNEQSCCENWGYFMTNDDLEEFVGQELRSISIVDTSLNVKKLSEAVAAGYEGYTPDDVSMTMFVNLETSNGTLQFTAYNDHNGYYGHDAIVMSEQLNHSTVL